MDNTPLIKNHNNHEEEKQVSLVKEFGYESKRLWKLAGPAIFTTVCQYSLGALTQTFAGLVGELELAAVSVENSVVAGLAYGIMVYTFLIFLFFWFSLVRILFNLSFLVSFSGFNFLLYMLFWSLEISLVSKNAKKGYSVSFLKLF